MTTAVLEQPLPRWRKLVGSDEPARRTLVLGSASAVLVLTGSFLNFLSFNHYPLLRPESAILLAALCAIGLLVGLLGTWSAVLGRVCFPLFAAVLALDFNCDGIWPLAVAGIVGFAVLRFLRQGLILLFAVIVATSLWTLARDAWSGGVPESWRHMPAAVATGPTPDFAVVHVILDEHIGLDGIPDSVPGGAALRETLRQFYAAQGFRVFGGAYSESMRTVHAIPRALGLADAHDWETGRAQGTIVRDNPYFDRLQAMGFHIAVAENDWLEYCEHPAVVACLPRSAGALVDLGDALPTSDKAALLAFRFVSLSDFLVGMLAVYDVSAMLGRLNGLDIPLTQVSQRSNTSALIGMATLQDTIGAAHSLKPGEALFAHALVPHYPYVYDRGCKLRRFADWMGRLSLVPWETRYAAYFEQIECVTAKIGELVAAIRESPAGGKTVIVIHGDHGSRIMHMQPSTDNADEVSERDLIDGYAAFFAVSAPTIEPGYDGGRYPLRYLLDSLAQSGFRSATPSLPAGFDPTIAIEDENRDPAMERSLRDTEWWKLAPTGSAN